MNTNSEYLRSRELLSAATSRLLIIDVQEKLMPMIQDHERVAFECRRLIQAAALFSVPISATEQYPKGLGGTVQPVADALTAAGVTDLPEKVRFSSAEVLNWGSAAALENNRDQVVVAGIEAHVCVLQTSFDLLAMGYRVSVVADAVSSRAESDHQYAMQRLQSNGATLVTTESVLFEWCEVAGTPEFKTISKLVQERAE